MVMTYLQGMQQLGEYASTHPQLIFAGQNHTYAETDLAAPYSVTEQICIVYDAIALNNQEQHIQWIDNMSARVFIILSTYSLTRLWNLRAPSEYRLVSQRHIIG